MATIPSFDLKDWLELEIFLNQLAQGIWLDTDAAVWFAAQPDHEKPQINHRLYYMVIQAGGYAKGDSQSAIQRSGLKPTFTPCVLLSRNRAPRIPNLPLNEQLKSFQLLVAWFSLADERRRGERCKGDCSHWWHQDLRDEPTLQAIRARYPGRLLCCRESLPVTYLLLRMDDNGTQALVSSHLTREAAEAACLVYEARGHKQTYWVEEKQIR
ncbi:MAG: hypothetical protein J0I12_23800 [Candidatus Eremiobacteraeota bacterium]|nr:hypothetical protein [Candidatus Eremiobacteraeota bacterium]